MTDKDLEKLLQNFGQTLANDGEAIGLAIALTKKDAKNVAMSYYASPVELGYMLSKAVESIFDTLETPEDIDDFSRGLIETIRTLNRKNRNAKRVH